MIVMVATLAAATTASQDQPGWGKLVALLLAAGAFWLGVTIHQRVKTLNQQPSPTDAQKTLDTVKAQVKPDSDSEDSGQSDGGEVVPLRSRQVEEFIGQRDGQQRPTALVQEARRRFRTSESTAWRALRKSRKGGGAA